MLILRVIKVVGMVAALTRHCLGADVDMRDLSGNRRLSVFASRSRSQIGVSSHKPAALAARNKPSACALLARAPIFEAASASPLLADASAAISIENSRPNAVK